MPLSLAPALNLLPERLRSGLGRRAAGLILALLIELILALLLLTLRPDYRGQEESNATPVFTMEASDDAEPETEPEAAPEAAPAEEAPVPPTPAEPRPVPPVTAPPVTTPVTPPELPYIPMTRDTMASADIARPPAPAAPAPARRPAMGPPDTGRSSGYGDTELVGTAPNGEPLYAAAWYREPYPEELRGYLSTAQGPGWGLIACRTAPDYRVEDCVSLGESPEGSNIARATLAAAWQFKVRPPRVGGQAKIGEWVRIRIDYGIEGRRR